MSRLKNYALALGSSYLALGANIAFTLVSVPLALSYLSKPQFALWGLSIQIAGYIALVDVGMAGVSRILIDYKDQKDNLAYGSVIQTSVLVSAAQALLILIFGVGLAFALPAILRVPPALHREFVLLVIGQCALLAAAFITRIFTFLLSAHQRQDVLNYAQVLLFLGNLGVLWVCFKSGLGVFSVLWAQLCGWVLSMVISIFWCYRLHVFPRAECWGRPTWERFSELFVYGRDIFLFVLGSQLINASQIILITRQLGLDVAAVWVICTRTYTLVTQLVYRIFDNSCPALAEMMVRQEKERLLSRFKSIVVISASSALAVGVVFAACNQPFVQLWTDGRAGWWQGNDVLLAAWLVISVCARCHVGLVGQAKQFGFLRYLYFLEGLWFVGWSLLLLRFWGISAMLVVGILGTFLFSLPYGIWRTARYFQIPLQDVAVKWSWPALRLSLALVPIAILIFWMVRRSTPGIELAINATVTTFVAAVLMWCVGLDRALRAELLQRFAIWRRKQ